MPDKPERRAHLRVVREGGDAPVAVGDGAPDSDYHPALAGIEAAVAHLVSAWVTLVQEGQVARCVIEPVASGVYAVACDLASGSSVWLRVALTLAPVFTLEVRVEPLRPE